MILIPIDICIKFLSSVICSSILFMSEWFFNTLLEFERAIEELELDVLFDKHD